MKRYLKDYCLTIEDVEIGIFAYLKNKWKRKDVSYFLAEYCIQGGEDIHEAARRCRKLARKAATRHFLYETIQKIAYSLFLEIEERRIVLKPIEYQLRLDKSSNKIREIGISSVKQQIYDYVAVTVCKEMFIAKIGYYQCASISKKGQVFGKNSIEKWLKTDSINCRCYYKCDIRQYYPSVDKNKLKELLSRDIKNEDILYLIFALLDTYKDGLCIGSYLSQYLANYYLSYAYHFIAEQSFSIRRTKDGQIVRVNHVKHQLYYMDDIIMFSSSKKLLLRAVRDFENYISDELHLSIKEGAGIHDTRTESIDMMGYQISSEYTIMRKRIYDRVFRIMLRGKRKRHTEKFSVHFSRKVLAYHGWIKNSNVYAFRKRLKIDDTVNEARKAVQEYDKNHIHRQAG